MKNVIKLFVLLLCSIIAVSCNKQSKEQPDPTNKIAAQVIKEVQNPEFMTTEDFTHYVLNDREVRRCQAILDTMSVSKIQEISDVILKRDGSITYLKFLKEYDNLYNKVYRYLGSSSQIKIVPETIYVKQNEYESESTTKDASSDVHRK